MVEWTILQILLVLCGLFEISYIVVENRCVQASAAFSINTTIFPFPHFPNYYIYLLVYNFHPKKKTRRHSAMCPFIEVWVNFPV
jgi:DMSO/TMAO reductase YedYZ heme-binding membrane subunit